MMDFNRSYVRRNRCNENKKSSGRRAYHVINAGLTLPEEFVILFRFYRNKIYKGVIICYCTLRFCLAGRFHLQTKLIRNHRNKFTVGGLAAAVVNGISKIRV